MLWATIKRKRMDKIIDYSSRDNGLTKTLVVLLKSIKKNYDGLDID